MKTRANIATALVLILLGAWFLAIELTPALKTFAYGPATWPIPIIGLGVVLGLLALVLWVPGMWVPASIVGGIGGLLYWQNSTGNWGSWAYLWGLIPCFVGAGIILSGIFERDRKAVIGGAWTLFGGVVMVAIFGSFLGGSAILSRYWPVLLIVLGLAFLFSGILRKR